MTLSTKDEIILRKAEILSRVLLSLSSSNVKWKLKQKIEEMLDEVK